MIKTPSQSRQPSPLRPFLPLCSPQLLLMVVFLMASNLRADPPPDAWAVSPFFLTTLPRFLCPFERTGPFPRSPRPSTQCLMCPRCPFLFRGRICALPFPLPQSTLSKNSRAQTPPPGFSVASTCVRGLLEASDLDPPMVPSLRPVSLFAPISPRTLDRFVQQTFFYSLLPDVGKPLPPAPLPFLVRFRISLQ